VILTHHAWRTRAGWTRAKPAADETKSGLVCRSHGNELRNSSVPSWWLIRASPPVFLAEAV